MTSRHDGTLHTLASVAAARWRIAIALTMVMMVVYVGFILLVAYNKPLMGLQLLPGVSVGMLLGVLVIVAAWAVTWIYVAWANTHHDSAVTGLRR
ncbi:MAG: DUF485 domain-containing protein [Vicinamibacterales bacterium]